MNPDFDYSQPAGEISIKVPRRLAPAAPAPVALAAPAEEPEELTVMDGIRTGLIFMIFYWLFL